MYCIDTITGQAFIHTMQYFVPSIVIVFCIVHHFYKKIPIRNQPQNIVEGEIVDKW